MKKLICLLLSLTFILPLSGCKSNSPDPQNLQGVWIISMLDLDQSTADFFKDGADTSYEFRADGSGKLTIFSIPLEFKYHLKGNKLTIEMPGEDEKGLVREYKIKLDDNKLYFSTGKYNMVFKKVQ